MKVLEIKNIPIVLLNNIIDIENLVCVTTDHYGGTYKAVEHLIEKGHRDIAIISGHFSPYVYNERFRAYSNCLKKNGIEINKDFIKSVEPNIKKFNELC